MKSLEIYTENQFKVAMDEFQILSEKYACKGMSTIVRHVLSLCIDVEINKGILKLPLPYGNYLSKGEFDVFIADNYTKVIPCNVPDADTKSFLMYTKECCEKIDKQRTANKS